MIKQIFVNLAVKDLKKSMDYFTKLGFKFNPVFTDENAACMILGENIYAMLLVEKFFKTFLPDREICNTKKHTEVLNAVSVGSRKEVDEMVVKAISAGGKEYREKQDYGWMYSRAFIDMDGHIWEVLYADEKQLPKK